MRRHPEQRRGQALVEFAVIAFILYLLLAATLELGRATFGVQTIQAAADLAAREISRTPLSPTSTMAEALDHQTVRERIFDERLLVIDLNRYTDPDFDFNDLFRRFPVVNQQLRTVMIVDRSSPGRPLLRYPGALVNKGPENDAGWPDLEVVYNVKDDGLRVMIPTVTYGGDGSETIINWVKVIEEIDPGSFTLEPRPGNEQRQGFAGVRINYPFQAASLVNYKIDPNRRFDPNGKGAIVTDDAITAPPLPDGRTLADLTQDTDPTRQLQPNGGRFGLGSLLAAVPNKGGQRVRPFRRLLAGQAIYRREVFAP